jgi:hypothetical protein
MSVPSGSQLGSYEILSLLGVGGMGQVYRARDPRLGRVVAIKTLPQELSSAADRVERFKQEARILASLNHPGIATIYDIEEVDGSHAIVMELVEGETLADRLSRRGGRPLATAEAIAIGRQIADALDAAHEKGIVHRDLKPGNVMIAPSGTVKVLDFGIAKVQAEAGSSSGDATLQATEYGTVLGTGPYMSPEQARGTAADKRTDIWAFGCVLYELLTGVRAFRGDTPQDVLSAILEREPDWTILPSATPRSVVRLLRRCLEKDPRRRLRDIGDARAELEDSALAEPPLAERSVVGAARWRALAAGVLGAAVMGVALWLAYGSGAAAPPPTVARWTVPTPARAPLARFTGGYTSFGQASLSPDGSRVVYVAALPDGGTQLYQRAFDERRVRAIAGTEGASAPFFSPDGESIGFFAGGSLKRMPAEGGQVTTICDVGAEAVGATGTWGSDGTIVFAAATAARKGLFRVSDVGGSPEPLTHPEPSQGGSHGNPWFIDGARAVLFVETFVNRPSIRVLSLATGEQRTLIEGGNLQRPIYVPTGHLIYVNGASLMALRFDVARRETRGEPVRVLDDVSAGALSIGANGRLAYSVAARQYGRLVWVNRDGAISELFAARQELARPRLSPDGERLAVEVRQENVSDVGWLRLDNRNLSLLGRAGANAPQWTRDGAGMIFRAEGDLFSWVVGDPREPQPFLRVEDVPVPAAGLAPGGWTPDGSTYVFVTQGNTSTAADIWASSLGGDKRPLVDHRRNQWAVRVSPDGQWISYASDESGQFEIYVQSLQSGSREKISIDGGWQAMWSADGSEIFYRAGDRMMVVPVTTSPTFRAGMPRELFRGAFASTDIPNYDVTRDGQRFVMVQATDEAEERALQIVDHWFEELARLVPAEPLR